MFSITYTQYSITAISLCQACLISLSMFSITYTLSSNSITSESAIILCQARLISLCVQHHLHMVQSQHYCKKCNLLVPGMFDQSLSVQHHLHSPVTLLVLLQKVQSSCVQHVWSVSLCSASPTACPVTVLQQKVQSPCVRHVWSLCSASPTPSPVTVLQQKSAISLCQARLISVFSIANTQSTKWSIVTQTTLPNSSIMAKSASPSCKVCLISLSVMSITTHSKHNGPLLDGGPPPWQCYCKPFLQALLISLRLTLSPDSKQKVPVRDRPACVL